jgi:hypothetical protein
MITLIIASIITALFYLLWKNERQTEGAAQKPPSGRVPLWLLLGILSMAALLSPKIRDRINEIRQKYHL